MQQISVFKKLFKINVEILHFDVLRNTYTSVTHSPNQLQNRNTEYLQRASKFIQPPCCHTSCTTPHEADFFYHRLVLPSLDFHVNKMCKASLTQQNISDIHPC